MKPAVDSLAKFAEAKAAERLKTFAAKLRLAKKQPGEAASIHDLRVSIRRFNQSLRVFKNLFERGHYRKMRRRLRKLMELCGAVRNCDIAVEVLAAAGAPANRVLKAHLRKLRTQGESELAEGLKEWDFRWRAWLHTKPSKNQKIETRARQVLRTLEREYRRAATTDLEKLHEFRLAAKHLRYTLEIFGPFSGEGWERKIERIREAQELLGAVNDCVTTSALIKEHSHDTAAVKRLLTKRLAAFRALRKKRSND
jgi:CHAD domain-containing protein